MHLHENDDRIHDGQTLILYLISEEHRQSEWGVTGLGMYNDYLYMNIFCQRWREDLQLRSLSGYQAK